LFWKKKKVDLELPGDDSDHREAFRIRPIADRPIILKLLGKSFYMVNISGTGCCIRTKSFKEGTVAAGTITIPSEDQVFPVSIRVVSLQRDLCRCEFVKISQQAQNLIHGYVLETQKSLLRSH